MGSIKRARVQPWKIYSYFVRSVHHGWKANEQDGESTGWIRVGFAPEHEWLGSRTKKKKKKKIASQRRGKGFCTGDGFFVRLTSWKCRGHVNPRLLDVRSRSPRGERKSTLREKCPRKKRGIARAINFNWEQHVDVLHKPLGKSQFFLLFRLPTFIFPFLFLVCKRPPSTTSSSATYPHFW